MALEINLCAEKQLCAGCCNHNHSSARQGCEKTLIIGLCLVMGFPTWASSLSWSWSCTACKRSSGGLGKEELTFDKHFLLDYELKLSQVFYWHFVFCSRIWTTKLFKRWKWLPYFSESMLPQASWKPSSGRKSIPGADWCFPSGGTFTSLLDPWETFPNSYGCHLERFTPY